MFSLQPDGRRPELIIDLLRDGLHPSNSHVASNLGRFTPSYPRYSERIKPTRNNSGRLTQKNLTGSLLCLCPGDRQGEPSQISPDTGSSE